MTLDIVVAGASPVGLAVASILSDVSEGCRQRHGAQSQLLCHVHTKVVKGLGDEVMRTYRSWNVA